MAPPLVPIKLRYGTSGPSVSSSGYLGQNGSFLGFKDSITIRSAHWVSLVHVNLSSTFTLYTD